MALRQLAYGGSSDMFDEYLRIADSAGRLILWKFYRVVIAAFGDEYLRRPTQMDCARLLRMHEAKQDFPGMLGNVDCMLWTWKNCPTACAGAYLNYKKGCPTLILEVVASTNLWIRHAFFGVARSNNDVLNGVAPAVSFRVNNNLYQMGYYLAAGIYPK